MLQVNNFTLCLINHSNVASLNTYFGPQIAPDVSLSCKCLYDECEVLHESVSIGEYESHFDWFISKYVQVPDHLH